MMSESNEGEYRNGHDLIRTISVLSFVTLRHQIMMSESNEGEYRNGPDQIIPCNNLITWDPTAPVKIRMENNGYGNEEPVSIPSLVKRNATQVPNSPALKTKNPQTGEETV